MTVIKRSRKANKYQLLGKDATEVFEDIGHSDEARELLEKFYIGDLDTAGVSCQLCTFICFS